MEKPDPRTYYFANNSDEWHENQKRWDNYDAFIKKSEKAKDFRFFFGKYKGKTIGQVNVENPGYLKWLLNNFEHGEITMKIKQFYEENG